MNHQDHLSSLEDLAARGMAEYESQHNDWEKLSNTLDQKINQHILMKKDSGLSQRGMQKSLLRNVVLLFLALGLAFAAYYLFTKSTQKQSQPEYLYASYLDSFPNMINPASRSINDAGPTLHPEVDLAMARYVADDFENALISFKKIDFSQQENLLYLYAGITALKQKEFKQAREWLDQLIGDQIIDQKSWFLALTDMAEGKKEAAILKLNELIQEHAYKKKQAKEILSKLE